MDRIDVGDAAKLREALEKCANWGEQIDCQLGSSDETVYAFRHERCLAHNISECARAALATPARNCDRYANHNDAMRAFDAFVRKQGKLGFINPYTEAFKWLFATATEKEGGNDGNE